MDDGHKFICVSPILRHKHVQLESQADGSVSALRTHQEVLTHTHICMEGHFFHFLKLKSLLCAFCVLCAVPALWQKRIEKAHFGFEIGCSWGLRKNHDCRLLQQILT